MEHSVVYASSPGPAGPPGFVGETGEEGPEGFSYGGDPGRVTCRVTWGFLLLFSHIIQMFL